MTARHKPFLPAVLGGLVVIAVVAAWAEERTDSQRPGADLNAFVKECARARAANGKVQVVRWFSWEYTIASNIEEYEGNREQLEQEIRYLRPYIICMVMRKPVGTSHGVALDEADVRRAAKVLDRHGRAVAPLDQVPPEVADYLARLREAIGRVAMAAQYVFLVFPRQDVDGNVIVDEQRRDKLTVVLQAADGYPEFRAEFRTPFDAASPPIKCPSCADDVSRKWSYCAWCGVKLPASADDAAATPPK